MRSSIGPAPRPRGDGAAADAALATLQQYRRNLGKFLTDANPKISGDAESHALQLHLDQLTSFVGMDYAQSFATERAAYSHMFEFGDDLARAIIAQFPDHYPDGNVAFSPRTTTAAGSRATARRAPGRGSGGHAGRTRRARGHGRVSGQPRGQQQGPVCGHRSDLRGRRRRRPSTSCGAATSRPISTTSRRSVKATSAARADALASLHSYHSALAEFLNGAIPALSRGGPRGHDQPPCHGPDQPGGCGRGGRPRANGGGDPRGVRPDVRGRGRARDGHRRPVPGSVHGSQGDPADGYDARTGRR